MIYDIHSKNVEFKQEHIKKTKDYSLFKISSKSIVPSNFEENDTNIAFLFLPYEVIFDRVVILIHGMGTRNLKHLTYFGKMFSKKGMPLLIPILPFHYERRIKGKRDGEKFLIDDIKDSIRNYRQAVIDIRVNMNILESIGLGSKGFSLLGFSFGGMIGTILMGVDKRIKNGVLVATGGNFEYITWQSPIAKSVRKKYEVSSNKETYGCNEKICKELHKQYTEIINTIKHTEDIEKINFPKECFLFDPLTFAPLIKGRKVVIFRAMFDEIFPKESTVALKEAIGQSASLINILSDHYLVILYRRFIFNKALELFKEAKV